MNKIASNNPDGLDRADWYGVDALQGRATSVWRLERVKAAAEMHARPIWPGEASIPRKSYAAKLMRKTVFAAIALAALCIFAIYIMVYCLKSRGAELPANASRLVAVHGEWSTRTKHVLAAVTAADPPINAILLLGRQTQRTDQTAQTLYENLPALRDLPVLAPVDLKAVSAASGRIFALLRTGLREAGAADRILGLREELALAFRVYLGATQAHWWQQQKQGAGVELLFGSTGNADTTLLERAVQQSGGRTVHLVHGQAIGPNFAGMSDCAVFKSQYDAIAYDRLKCYKTCTAQLSGHPEPRRGDHEILVMTNLAHPMNAEFRRNGIVDEVNFLECVSKAANLLSIQNAPLVWKPHPVTYSLDPALLQDLQSAAKSLGFRELPKDTSLAEASQNARWVISTPSTVAIELLQIGTLAVVLDPQRTVGSSALSAMPGLASLQPEGLATLMAAMDDPETYSIMVKSVYSAIEPAGPLDLTVPLV